MIALSPATLPRMVIRFLMLFVIAAGFALPPVGFAQLEPANEAGTPGTPAWVREVTTSMEAATASLQGLAESENPQAMISDARSTAARVRGQAQVCLDSTDARLAEIENRLATLGESTSGESPEVRATRQDLTEERKRLGAGRSACRLAQLRAEELASASASAAQSALAVRLLERGPHIVTVFSSVASNPAQRVEALTQDLVQATGASSLGLIDTGVLVLLLIAGAFAGRWAGSTAAPARCAEVADCVSGSAIAMRAAAARSLPWVLPAAAVSAYLGWRLGTGSPVALAGYGVTGWLILATFIRALLRPPPPAQPFLPLTDRLRHSMFVRATVLSILLLVGFLAFMAIPWRDPSMPLLLALRALYAAFLAFNLSWILILSGRFLTGGRGMVLRLGAAILLIAGLGAEWGGYRNLSAYLLLGLAGTLLALIFAALLLRFFSDLFDGLDEGRLAWQRSLRRRLGLADGNRMPGVVWLRALTTLTLWAAVIFGLLRSWGMSDEGTAMLGRWLTEGVRIGEVHLVPAQLVAAVLVFAVFTTVVRWLRQRVIPGWLVHTRFDHGAREAITTMTSYAGMALAALVALSMAGINFQNLALVAGALSVGIGFGLQNIVNNFVSGLILLFERPIRTGDWIVVGNTEGYVRRISIRSTRLETFDRSEVIIPNSELATTQVTNWQLRDSWGRVTVPVGVAYGSDTAKVAEILHEIATGHPRTMRGVPGVPDPVVLFRGFGDSSLDFELRFFIAQIDLRLHVISEINFAIDKAFRAEGIEIPFPQHDVHMKEMPQGAHRTPHATSPDDRPADQPGELDVQPDE